MAPTTRVPTRFIMAALQRCDDDVRTDDDHRHKDRVRSRGWCLGADRAADCRLSDYLTSNPGYRGPAARWAASHVSTSSGVRGSPADRLRYPVAVTSTSSSILI